MLRLIAKSTTSSINRRYPNNQSLQNGFASVCNFTRVFNKGEIFRNFSSCEPRESMNYDVVVVGAGPAGLAAAIRFKQMCREKDVDLSVCVVEKGAEVGE